MSRRLLQSPSFDLTWEPRLDVFRLETPGRLIEGVPGVEFVHNSRARTLTALELQAGRETETRIEDVHGQASELQLQYQEAQGLALTLRIRLYPGRPFVLLRLCVTNVGPDLVRLRRFFVRTVPDGLTLTQPPSGAYVNGWQSWSYAGARPVDLDKIGRAKPVRWPQGPPIWNPRTPWSRYSDRIWSETVGAIISSREALIGGIASVAEQFGQMWADLRPAHLQVMLQTQMDDVPLAVGEARHSEWFYLEWVPLPNGDPFAQYAHAVARQMDVAPRRQMPTGWGSWHIYGSEVGEADVMENLASAALLADELPLGVLRLDEGYQAAWGDWSTRGAAFPHSLEWLAARIRGSDFIPGLWLAPLVASRKSRLARDHPGWLLRGRHGRIVRCGAGTSFAGLALDATHPEVIDHLRELVGTVVDTWGYGQLELDHLYAAALVGKRYDTRTTRAQAMRQVLQAIRDVAGPDVTLVANGAPLGPAVGLVDAMRIGPSTASYWEPNAWEPRRLSVPGSSKPSLRNSLRNVAARAWMHGRWWANDPDALIMRDTQTELTPDEVLAQATLVGLSGGLTMLSDDLDHIPTARRAVAAFLFPPLLDGMDVLDLVNSSIPTACVVPVARPWGRWRLVALFNWSEEPIERELPEAVSLDERTAYHLVDFWEQRYLLMEPGALRPVLHIPPHGVVLLALRPQKPEPHLVSTTFHISQGAEVSQWALGDGELSLRLGLGRVARGAVWLALPARPQSAYLDDALLPPKAVHAVSAGVWSIACQLNSSGTLRVVWDAGQAA